MAQNIYTIGTDTIPSTLYAEGYSASSGTLGFILTSPSNAQIHKDELMTSVVNCNLSIDSNNNGSIDSPDDAIEETYPGKYIALNSDDDDSDGIIDLEDGQVGTGGTYPMGASENEMVTLNLSAGISYYYGGGMPGVPQTNPYAGYKLKITYSSNIKLWKQAAKGAGNSVANDAIYTIGTDTAPTVLYVEGIAEGQGNIVYSVTDSGSSVGGVIPVRIKQTRRYSQSTGVLKVKETDSAISQPGHPEVTWVNIPTTDTGSYVIESSTTNAQTRITETIYRYKWNTITTPLPNYGTGGGMGGGTTNQTHNGQHTLRYEQSIGGLPKAYTDLNVNVTNLSVSCSPEDVIVWKGLNENDEVIEPATITVNVNDNDTSDPYTVTVNIYHTGSETSGTTNGWTPVRTITLTNAIGPTQTITWNGELNTNVSAGATLSHSSYQDAVDEIIEENNGVPPLGGVIVPVPEVAEPWTYTFDVTVTQSDTQDYYFNPNPTTKVTWSSSDSARLRSDYLTISRATDANGNYIHDAEFVDATYPDEENLVEGDPYIVSEQYYSRFYNLKDSKNINASSIFVKPFDLDLDPMQSLGNTFLCTHENCDSGRYATLAGITHEIQMGVESINNAQPSIFNVISVDNHGLLYRNHNNKSSTTLNSRKKLNKIKLWFLSYPYEDQHYYYYNYNIFITNLICERINSYFKSINKDYEVCLKGYVYSNGYFANEYRYSGPYGGINFLHPFITAIPDNATGDGHVLIIPTSVSDKEGFVLQYTTFPKDRTEPTMIYVNTIGCYDEFYYNSTAYIYHMANTITHELTHVMVGCYTQVADCDIYNPRNNINDSGLCIFNSSLGNIDGELPKYNHTFKYTGNKYYNIKNTPWKHQREILAIKNKMGEFTSGHKCITHGGI